MRVYSVPFGTGMQEFRLPEDWNVSILKPKHREGLKNPAQKVGTVLKRLGGRLNARNPGSRAVISINDKTRPVPHHIILPPLLSWLETAGYQRRNITLIIAVGTHTTMPPSEYPLILPEEIRNRYRVISHDAEDTGNLINLGYSDAGTPCSINRTFYEADLKIVTGNIEPHQYMGWSGGVKSAVIGLGGSESIRKNHSMLTRDGAGPCRFEDNPVRMDVEDSGRRIGIQLALNTVMNASKEITAVFAGPPEKVMREGIREARSLFTVPFHSEFDLLIASPGGYPKDINLYQSQKALRHASLAVRPGSPMILAGACSEGVGHGLYESWMKDKTSHRQVQEAFQREEFRLGPHKAMLFASDVMNRDVYFVSDLPDKTLRNLLLTPASSIQEAIDDILKKNGSGHRLNTAILPYGNATVPMAVDSDR